MFGNCTYGSSWEVLVRLQRGQEELYLACPMYTYAKSTIIRSPAICSQHELSWPLDSVADDTSHQSAKQIVHNNPPRLLVKPTHDSVFDM
jgi:hypothetical protein